ncbi:PDZ domain-containing protein [Microbulbifer halophilus]|uniref:PDZ domain-containing protein n=1 Tax=Microbulbifer halophilus TaxID=453963 RepID=A0ABW5E9U1_9GAMM|nr:PDZ domain-containing protein [Microbulbifer halophilus]MCW8127566.1 PDZ domain-containing protein [Microbulbifer halophilus]
MKSGKPALITAVTLLLIAVTYIAYGALNRSATADGEQPGAASLFGGNETSLEKRVQSLEKSLRDANRMQSQLLELVEDLGKKLEQVAPADASVEDRTAAIRQSQHRETHSGDEQLSRGERYRKYRRMQLQRLIDAGLNPDRAEYILERQERFQYEHMQITHEYRHLKDKSSPEAQKLKEKLSNYSHPRKMFEHELNEQEFERYLEVNGGQPEMQIDRVLDNTPARNAGLQPGDKIISYNGERIFHSGDLRSQIYKVAPGETVEVEVQRAGSSAKEVIYVPSGPLGIQG